MEGGEVMKTAYNDEQVQMARGLVNHYCAALGVGINDLAETTGISRERLEQFANSTLPELSATEMQKFFDLAQPLASAERAEIDSYEARGQQVPFRTYENVIAEVVQLQGGEKEQ
jgi:hypothetical protein